MSMDDVLRWKPFADKYAALYPPLQTDEILAYILTESSGVPTRMNPFDPSFGLGSITIPIIRKYSNPPLAMESQADMDAVFDPDRNIQILSRYASILKQRFQQSHPTQWQAAYNQGEGNEAKGLEDAAYANNWSRNLAQVRAALNSSSG